MVSKDLQIQRLVKVFTVSQADTTITKDSQINVSLSYNQKPVHCKRQKPKVWYKKENLRE